MEFTLFSAMQLSMKMKELLNAKYSWNLAPDQNLLSVRHLLMHSTSWFYDDELRQRETVPKTGIGNFEMGVGGTFTFWAITFSQLVSFSTTSNTIFN